MPTSSGEIGGWPDWVGADGEAVDSLSKADESWAAYPGVIVIKANAENERDGVDTVETAESDALIIEGEQKEASHQ